MDGDNKWILLALAVGLVLYLTLRNKQTAATSAGYYPAGYSASSGIPVASNPLAGTNLNPAVAPATASVTGNTAPALTAGFAPAGTTAPDVTATTAADPYGNAAYAVFTDSGADVSGGKAASGTQKFLVN